MPDSTDCDGPRPILSRSSCKPRRTTASTPLAEALALADAASALPTCARGKLMKLHIVVAREMRQLGGQRASEARVGLAEILKSPGRPPQEAAAIHRSLLILPPLPLVVPPPFLIHSGLCLLCRRMMRRE